MKIVRYMKTFICVYLVLLFVSLSGCDTVVQDGDKDPDYIANVSGHITVTYPLWLASDDQSKLSLTYFTKSFMNKYKGATVSIDYSDGNIDARIASDDIGDIFFIGDEDTYKYAIKHLTLMPLDAYLEILDIDTTNVYTGIYDIGTANGRLFMAPRDHNHIVLYYNETALDEQGLETPPENWTWEQFKDYGRQLIKQNEDETYSQIGAFWDANWGPFLIPFLEGWGGEWYDPVNKRISFTSDERVLQGFTEQITAMQEGILYPTCSTGKLASKYTSLSFEDYVFRGGVFPNIYTIGTQYESKGVKWNVANWPRFPTHKVGTGATGFGVYNRTKNPDTAAAFTLYLFTDEGQRAYHCQIGGSVPLTKNLALEDFWRVPYDKSECNYDAFISFPGADTVGKFQCRVPDSVSSIIVGRINQVFTRHFSGEQDYTDSLAEIEKLATEKWETLFEEVNS